jgi:hypothetical protein
MGVEEVYTSMQAIGQMAGRKASRWQVTGSATGLFDQDDR